MSVLENDELWVRLKPKNDRKGIKLDRFAIYGMRFEEKRGWYIIPSRIQMADGREVDLGAKLRTIRNDNEDPESALAFDVMTAKDAQRLDADERKAAQERVAAVDARPLRPVDITPTDSHADIPAGVAQPADKTPPAKRGPGRPRKSASSGV